MLEYTMNIEIQDKSKAESFCNIFQVVKTFSEHVNLTINDEKLYVQSMDASHIVIFEIHLPKEWFDVFEKGGNEENITIGIHAGVLGKVLNTRDKSQKIIIGVEDSGSDKIQIDFKGENEITSLDKHFHLPLMDIESEMLSIPEFDCDVNITIPSSNLSSIINQFQIFGDSLDFVCSHAENKVVVKSSGAETGKMEVDIVNSPQTECVIKDDVDMKVSFALYKMHDICCNTKLSKNVSVGISDCYPICVTYDVGNNGKMLFYLAPKVDDS